MIKIDKKFLIFILIVVIVAIAVVTKVKALKKEENSLPTPKIYPIIVKNIKVKKQNIILTLPSLAEVLNDKDVILSSKIPARVEKIALSGKTVKKGEIVAQLDTKDLQDEIKATKVLLQNILKTHKRTKELLKVKVASVEQYQKEESQIASIKAKLANLKNSLSYAVIKSPVSGVVSKTFINQGSITMPGKPVLSISSKNGFYLMVRVPSDTDIKGVIFENKIYTAIKLGTTFHGLAEYKVYVDKKLISGDRVEIDVITFNNKGILLPFDAVLDQNGKSVVLVVNKNKINIKKVNILKRGEQGVVIDNDELVNKNIIVAKPDILLKLVSGYPFTIRK